MNRVADCRYSKWKWPDVKGLWDFKGKLVHSAHWDNEYNWEGKRVAVLGNGNSGIQVVSSMQPKVARLVNFVSCDNEVETPGLTVC